MQTSAPSRVHGTQLQRFSTGARLVVLALCAMASIVASDGPNAIHAAGSNGTITGTVFQDFDSDGINDTTITLGQAADIGVGGIVVRAFDASGDQVGTATTSSNGTYSLSVSGAATADVRIEFTIPQNNSALSALRPSFATSTGASGSSSGSSVQFASLGDTGVSFAVNVPGEFCQNNPNIAVSRQCMNSTTAPSVWVSRYNGGPYTTSNGYSTLYNDWSATTAASVSTTGSVHGLAWDVVSGRVLSAAYVRSFSRLYESPVGTPRPAALFSTTPAGRTEAQGTGGVTNFLVDLETLLPGDQFSNTSVPASGVANQGFTGYIPSNSARNLPLGPDSDINANYDGVYEEVGRTGIGDMDTDGNGNLYVVSLYTRELYRVALPADGSAPTSMTSVGSIVQSVSCLRGTARPFGVTHWRDNLYMGVVCDGSQDYNNAAPNSNSDERNVTYTIRRYSPSTNTWDTFIGPFPLFASSVGGNFKGSPIMVDQSVTMNHNSWRWNPWTDEFSQSWITGWAPVYPQPMPSDLQFDRDGSVIVSMRDRTGDRMTQFLTGSMYPDGSAHDGKGAISAGDIYRICRTGTGFTSSDYVWEGGTGCAQNFTNFGYVNETYRDDYGKSDIYHSDQSAGMLEYVPGFPEVINTAMDPHLGWTGSTWDITANTFSSSGLSYYVNSTGNRQFNINSGGGVIFGSSVQSFIGDGSFGKIVGMGDVEALCDMAPVQIGDRLWYDTDNDGVQDPGEAPIAGVTVRLYDEAGNLVSTTKTNTNGEYRFSSTVIEATSGGSTPDALGGNIITGVNYTVRLDNPADYTGSGPLTNYALSPQDATSATATDTDNAIDSDAAWVSSYPRISVPALTAGANNFTYDFGFVPAVGVGNVAWVDTDRDGVQDAGEPPLEGVKVELLNPDGTPATDAQGNPVPAQTTGADGTYFFDNLMPGDYRIKVTPPDGYVITTANSSSGTDTTDSDINQQSGISDIITVSPSATGNTITDTNPATVAQYVNLTADAGVVPTVSVGNYVWLDVDRDGVQDASEAGIAGVTLTITNADGSPVTDVFGNPVTTTTTDANGKYSFDNLPTGQYTVTVTPPPGYTATQSGAGTSATDSSTGSATSTNLTTPGARDATLDFGFYPSAVSVGDYVWYDVDKDGIQDDGEPPLADVVLTITKSDGSPVTDIDGNPVTTTTTDANGKYSFDNLPIGQYIVSAVTPTGFEPTVTLQGTPETDSSRGSATSKTMTQNGDRDSTLDFGFWTPPAAVGSRVWNDINNNGLQDPDEPGISGATLTLTTADGKPVRDIYGNPVTTTTTDANGNYLFSNLPFNTAYKVTITYPPQTVPTKEQVGDNRAIDSSTESAVSVKLTSRVQADFTLDFGVVVTSVSIEPEAVAPPARSPLLPRTGDGMRALITLSVLILLSGLGARRTRRPLPQRA